MTTPKRRPNVQLSGNPAVVYILIPTRTIPPTQNNNKEHMCTLTNGNRYIPNEKLMTIDVLRINLSSAETKISNSCCVGNGRHGHVANVPHLLDLYGNRPPDAGRASAPGIQ